MVAIINCRVLLIMFRCTGTKASGGSCKNSVRTEKGTCCWHTPITSTDPQCSVCLETMTTRNFRTLETCGHTFHPRCLKNWKRQGNRTCPLCREAFDAPEFTVTITIAPLQGEPVSLDASASPDTIFSRLNLDIDNLSQYSTELTFEADNLNNLRSILSEIGVDLNGSDLYSLIRRDTE